MVHLHPHQLIVQSVRLRDDWRQLQALLSSYAFMQFSPNCPSLSLRRSISAAPSPSAALHLLTSLCSVGANAQNPLLVNQTLELHLSEEQDTLGLAVPLLLGRFLK